MKKKICSFFTACLLTVLSGPIQSSYAYPPKKIPKEQSQSSSQAGSSSGTEETSLENPNSLPIIQATENVTENSQSLSLDKSSHVNESSSSSVTQKKHSLKERLMWCEEHKLKIASEDPDSLVQIPTPDLIEFSQISKSPIKPNPGIALYVTADGTIVCDDQTFGHQSNVTISGTDPSSPTKIDLNSLTLPRTSNVVFENLELTGKIDIVGRKDKNDKKPNVTFRNCIIHGARNGAYKVQNPKIECPVQVRVGSIVKFENCILDGGNQTKALVSVEDNGKAYFEHCRILNSSATGLLLISQGYVEATNCDFFNHQKFAVYPYKRSTAILKNCNFHDLPGKAIFALTESNISLQKCEFNDCNGGGISIADSCNAEIENCNFQKMGNSAIHLMKKCQTKILNCNFSEIGGNCINFESSTGEVNNCNFNDSSFPAMAIFEGANPWIQKCTFKNMVKSNCIVIRGNSVPVFEDITIEDNATTIPAILCADFCEPVFQGIYFLSNSLDTEVPANKAPEMILCDSAKVKIVQSPETKIVCFHENGKKTEHCLSEDFKCCLHISERLSGQAIIVSEEIDHKREYLINGNTKIKTDKFKFFPLTGIKLVCEYNRCPDPEHIKCAKHYEHADTKVVSSRCGHAITCCPICGNSDHDVFKLEGKKLKCKNCGVLDFQNEEHRCSICSVPIVSLCEVYENDGFENYKQVVSSSCGHIVCACEQDENSNSEDLIPEACPVCGVPVEDVSECVVGKCSICLDNPSTCIALPCGHKCICDECAPEITLNKKQCPICRGKITGFKHDFSLTSKKK